MKKSCQPYVEIMIKNFQTKEYRWAKVCGNTAYHNNEGESTSHFKIDGNQFLKIVEKYQAELCKLKKKPCAKSGLCMIKFANKKHNFLFHFEYENAQFLDIANAIYADLMDLISNFALDYEKEAKSICEEINSLLQNQIFDIECYFCKHGIISPDDQEFLKKDIERLCETSIKKKKFAKNFYIKK